MLVKCRHSRPIPEGATLFDNDGKRYARWTTPAGRTMSRPLNRKGDRIVAESPCWYVRLRDRQTGKWREWKAYNDRQASQAMEIEILKSLERGEMGLIDTRAVERKRPVSQHLEDFESYLDDKGNTRDHIDKTVARCQRVIDHLPASTASDLTAEGIERCLAEFRRGGMSAATSNGYFRAVRTLCRWLVRTKRLGENPVSCLSCVKVTDADRKRRRRRLTSEEVDALMKATRQSPQSFMGLSGEDRAMLYALAMNTGLRASELASLTPESFELDGDAVAVRCLAGYTKNGQEAEQPLRQDMAASLRDWLKRKPAGQPVWPGKWASDRHGAEMIRMDLASAKVAYEDSRKRVVDFHALRHTFISNLARAGVHPRNAQALARHSTIDLTMNVYTHVGMDDLSRDVENLPPLMVASASPAGVPADASPATGTATIPDELASLAANWSSMPAHIRQAIATLAQA